MANRTLVPAIASAERPLKEGPSAWEPLLETIGDARIVLLGEATHGTHEFYNARAQITRRLIVEKNFDAVAVEADWPDSLRESRASEVGRLMRAARSVRGVKAVDDQLDVHDHPGNIPALQGARGPRSPTGHGMTENWPPSVRVLAAAAGASLAVVSLFRRGPMNLVGPVLGGALLMRAAANKSLKRAAGFSRTKSVHIDKEMFVAAPPERVFEFWRHQENFPQFMRNVQEVQAAGEDRWHWKVAGPLGPVEWDAEIVEREENRRLAWHTLPGTPVESEGRIDFEPEGEGTRLRVSMGYTPVAGALGHAAARLFGKDAKSEMDEDLMRVKSYLETGVAARDAAGGQRNQAEDARRLH